MSDTVAPIPSSSSSSSNQHNANLTPNVQQSSPNGMLHASMDVHNEVLMVCSEGVDARDFEENTALIAAASAGQIETVKQLLDNGAHPDSQNVYGYTPLLAALSHGHLSVASTLIQRGANVHLSSVEVCCNLLSTLFPSLAKALLFPSLVSLPYYSLTSLL
jgi:hypothetical protein